MKITKSQLKQLIKEELGAVLTEKSAQRGENDPVDGLRYRLETLELSVEEIEKQQKTIIRVLDKMIRGGEKR